MHTTRRHMLLVTVALLLVAVPACTKKQDKGDGPDQTRVPTTFDQRAPTTTTVDGISPSGPDTTADNVFTQQESPNTTVNMDIEGVDLSSLVDVTKVPGKLLPTIADLETQWVPISAGEMEFAGRGFPDLDYEQDLVCNANLPEMLITRSWAQAVYQTPGGRQRMEVVVYDTDSEEHIDTTIAHVQDAFSKCKATTVDKHTLMVSPYIFDAVSNYAAVNLVSIDAGKSQNVVRIVIIGHGTRLMVLSYASRDKADEVLTQSIMEKVFLRLSS